MKKQIRNVEKFQVLEMFAGMAAEHGFDLADPDSVERFVARVKRSLEKSKQSKTTIYGKRVEALFAYVAGALGQCRMLKQEDAGDLYFASEDVLAPDYRLTMFDQSQILVEVKNYYSEDLSKKFSFTKAYYEKLKRYSDLNHLPLFFAVYFAAWNRWVLLSISAFDETEREFSIDFASAMAKSEMLMLGDMIVGVTPNLELRLLGDPSEIADLDENGNVSFVIRDVQIFCAGNEVKDEAEKRIAFYFMRFGDWVEKTEPVVEGNRLQGMSFIYSPRQRDEQQFAFIGQLSAMVSTGFRELTVEGGDVVALTLGIDPSAFSILIPDDYEGKDLPIWRFKIRANADFNAANDFSKK